MVFFSVAPITSDECVNLLHSPVEITKDIDTELRVSATAWMAAPVAIRYHPRNPRADE
jgi:hypothetical protein